MALVSMIRRGTPDVATQRFHGDVRRWSPADDALLSAGYPGGLDKCRSLFPNRSLASILARAKRLGLSRASFGPKRPWTGADEVKLRRLWVTAPRSVIQAQISDRSWPAIVTKAGKMGLAARSMAARHPLLTSKNPLIEEIAKRMRDRGITLSDLDELADIGRNVSGRWFSDQSRPTLANVGRAVAALGGRLEIIWERDD